jgi:hypothetical protein
MRPLRAPLALGSALLGCVALGLSPAVAATVAEPSGEPVLCVVVGAAPAGLDSDAVRDAVAIEQRKAGRQIAVVVAGLLGECPKLEHTAGLLRAVLGPDARAVLSDGQGEPRAIDLADIEAVDRASEVARAAVEMMASVEAPERVVDLSAPLVLPREDTERAVLKIGGHTALGGGYAHELGPGAHRGVVDGEVGLTLLDRRLVVAAKGRWTPEHDASAPGVSASTASGEALLVLRGGLWTGPLLWRLGLGAGWHRRSFRAQPEARFEDFTASSDAAVFLVEPEVLWSVGQRLTLSLGVPVQFYAGGTNFRWTHEEVYAAPWASVGVVARAGFWLF